MASNYKWKIDETLEDESTVSHSVSLVCSYITGKAIITIDGDKYDISTDLFSLRGTRQMFRLGDMAATIEFPKSGKPRIIIDGKPILPKG